MENSIEPFLLEYPTHLDDVDWLSRAIVDLSAILHTIYKQLAQAELDESRMIVGYVDQMTGRDVKKMSVSEAEKRAMSDSNNAKHFLENEKDAVLELISSIKKRIDVVSLKGASNA